MKKTSVFEPAKAPLFSLDYTLRYLYDSVRYSAATLMAIRFKYRGREFVADTPEEAVRLQRMLEDEDSKRAKQDPHFRNILDREVAGWTEGQFWQVMNNLGTRQTQLLHLVLLYEVLGSEELAAGLDLSSQEALAGVVSGLSKQLTKQGVKPNDVFWVETHWVGKKKERFFRLTTGFAGVSAGSSWTAFWKNKKWEKEAEARIDKVVKRIIKQDNKLDKEIFGE